MKAKWNLLMAFSLVLLAASITEAGCDCIQCDYMANCTYYTATGGSQSACSMHDGYNDDLLLNWYCVWDGLR